MEAEKEGRMMSGGGQGTWGEEGGVCVCVWGGIPLSFPKWQDWWSLHTMAGVGEWGSVGGGRKR